MKLPKDQGTELSNDLEEEARGGAGQCGPIGLE